MKKHILLGILGVSLIAAIAFVLLTAAPRSVQYTWKAVILDSSANLGGGNGGDPYDDGTYRGWVYDDSDEFASVRVGIRTYVATKFKTTTYEPVLALEVLSPTQIILQKIGVADSFYDPYLIYCGFPEIQCCDLTSCWGTFLNRPHPQVGYQTAQLQHYGERCQTEGDADITTMNEGEVRVMHLSLYLQGQDIYGGTCDECNPENLHSVQGSVHGWNKSVPSDPYYDIYLTRIDANTWMVAVNTEFDNPDRQAHFDEYPFYTSYDPDNPPPDRIWESYCECVSKKVRNRYVITREIQYSSWVKAPLHYEMLFIRTPK